MGSVKDLVVYTEPTEKYLGSGEFDFSNRYSVFDWGKMPDTIPHKGEALCLMAARNFEKLRERGYPTHYQGVLNANNKQVSIQELTSPTYRMVISLSRVVKSEFREGMFDYSYFQQGRGKINNFVVPLEVIYRRGAPQGSSLFKTLDQLEKEEKSYDIHDLLSHYGLNRRPKPGDLFPKTGFDFTTKFEPTDRKISDEFAFSISGLTREQFAQLATLRQVAVNLVSLQSRKVGLIDYDGKHEYRLYNGQVAIADVFGTLDENRFMFNGKQVSKEFFRQVYKAEQLDWVTDVERAKSEAERRGIKDWKQLMTTQPQKLNPDLINLVGEMYASTAERYTGLQLFGARSLEEVMSDLEPYYPSQ